jgi:hypothetical protein
MKLALGALMQLKDLRLQQLQLPDHLREQSDIAATVAGPRSPLSLPHSLTRLEVHLAQQFCSTCAPVLACLTALQHLQLQDAAWLPVEAMPHSMTQLTHLQLCMAPDAFSNGYKSTLLRRVLPSNKQLRHLQLEFVDAASPYDNKIQVELWLCSALTTSSHLTSLQLSGVQFPEGSGITLFPAGRVLPGLTAPKLRGKAKGWWRCGSGYGERYDESLPIGLDDDMYNLVQCCPNLVELDLAGLYSAALT